MRYLALASDYDGTVAHDGIVSDDTVRALERLVHSGRHLILVTGRELPQLLEAFPRIDLCERVVAENGALLYHPATREKRILGERPPQSFIDSLQARGVTGVSAGEVIVATWHPFEIEVMEAIRESGLELQIIFNKDAVMVLPPGINKMTGLQAALAELELSRHNVVGIGDAENDHAFMDSCECSVAVANAIPSLKEKATIVTQAERGEGVAELIERLIANDLADADARLTDDPILIGSVDGRPITLPRHGRTVLVCGQSGSGKSSLVVGLLERIMNLKYQVCLVDPEGDYENLPGCRVVGDAQQAPSIKQVREALAAPESQVVVNMVGLSTADRPGCFASMVTDIQELRIKAGRPHWLVIDEAHHVLPMDWSAPSSELASTLRNIIFITVHPKHVAKLALSQVNMVIVVGSEPRVAVQEFAEAAGIPMPEVPDGDLERGEAMLWLREGNQVIPRFKVEPSTIQHSRHLRKYAEGELEQERVFYFRGPNGEMNLKAQNLTIFVALAEGLDEKTWQFHLKRGDYSNWFRHALKDPELAAEIERIEHGAGMPDRETRKLVREMILKKYTAPA